MGAYQNIVVGTDGSATSFAAVDRAGALAGATDATLIVVCAFHPSSKEEISRDQDALGADAGYQVVGSAPAEDTVGRARDRAIAAGATTVETMVTKGDPVRVLRDAVSSRQADLLVVGNRGLNTIAGRILGSVPADVARHARVDVLIVHTS
jgi:nucleotide-binding universal stress UspA family protein